MHIRSPYTASLLLVLFWWVASYLVLELYWPIQPHFYNMLISLNITAFVVCALDKLSAPSGRRVPERVLLGLALLGGGAGLLLAMNLVRHKTRKARFQLVLMAILLLQMVLWQALVYSYDFVNLLMPSTCSATYLPNRRLKVCLSMPVSSITSCNNAAMRLSESIFMLAKISATATG